MDNRVVLYDDGKISCDATGLTIRWYYLWGAKRIPYRSIRAVRRLSLGTMRRWRIWGSGDLVHWWNLDRRRPHKDVALVLDVGGRVRPTITPDDPEAVERVLLEHLGGA
jgi:Bacterial PH domain